MKHFYIAILIFAIITAGSFAEARFVKQTFSMMDTRLNSIYKSEITDENFTSRLNNMKNIFYSKKNMLQMFVNKEHINDIELNILLLENAAKNNDIEECRSIALKINNSIAFICNSQTAID